MGTPSTNNQVHKQFPLEPLSHADKILYVFFREYETSLELVSLRHSQIVQKLKQFATESTYSRFFTSTRTFYKYYPQLVELDYLNKTQELVGKKYHAYIVTPNGVSYIKQKINLLFHPPPPPVVVLTPDTANLSSQDIAVTSEVVSPAPPLNPPTSIQKPKMTRKTTKQQSLDQIISTQRDHTRIKTPSALEVAEMAAESSVQSAATINELLGKISELDSITQQIRSRVSSMPNSPYQPNSALIDEIGMDDMDDSNGVQSPQINQQNLDDELDAQLISDNGDFDYHFEGANSPDLPVTEVNEQKTPQHEGPIFPTVVKTFPSPTLPPKTKTEKEQLQEASSKELLQLISSGISDEHEQMVWDVVQQERIFTPDEKLEWFSTLLNLQGFSLEGFSDEEFSTDIVSNLIKKLQLEVQDLATAIDYFSPNLEDDKSSVPFESVILIADPLIAMIFAQTSNTQFGWNTTININNKDVGKIKLVHYFLGYFFQQDDYKRALSIIQNLQAEGQLTDASILIYAQILLNLRSYKRLELLLENLSKSRPQHLNQPELSFVAFRVYYEQRKFDKILNNPRFSEKWKILAQFEKDRIIQLDYSPILAQLKVMFLHLIPQHPEFYAQSKSIPQMVDYYVEQIRIESRPFLQFAPHFANWLHLKAKSYKEEDFSLPVLQEWLSFIGPVNEYVTLQEEIISDLRDWDVHPEEWIIRLTLIREFREQRQPLLEDFDLNL
jgi:hypothetical protein